MRMADETTTKAKKVPTFKKGQVGYNRGFGWPLIVTTAYYGKNPNGAVSVEVFGFEHECGSIYAKDIIKAESVESWKSQVNETPYYKGELVA